MQNSLKQCFQSYFVQFHKEEIVESHEIASLITISYFICILAVTRCAKYYNTSSSNRNHFFELKQFLPDHNGSHKFVFLTYAKRLKFYLTQFNYTTSPSIFNGYDIGWQLNNLVLYRFLNFYFSSSIKKIGFAHFKQKYRLEMIQKMDTMLRILKIY